MYRNTALRKMMVGYRRQQALNTIHGPLRYERYRISRSSSSILRGWPGINMDYHRMSADNMFDISSQRAWTEEVKDWWPGAFMIVKKEYATAPITVTHPRLKYVISAHMQNMLWWRYSRASPTDHTTHLGGGKRFDCSIIITMPTLHENNADYGMDLSLCWPLWVDRHLLYSHTQSIVLLDISYWVHKEEEKLWK